MAKNPTKEVDTLDQKNGTIVFVLGAGCSVDCGAPTMLKFMAAAREFYARMKDDDPLRPDYDRLFEFRHECLRVSYVFDRWWENIEDLFTQAHLSALIGTRNGTSLCEAMTRVIWDVYRRQRRDLGFLGYDGLLSYTHVLLENSAFRPVFVTTNYDLHLETAMMRARPHHPPLANQDRRIGRVVYPGRWNDTPDCTLGSLDLLEATVCSNSKLRMPRPFEVIKLHGSANWFRTKKATVRDATVDPLDIQARDLPVFNCQLRASYQAPGTPLIIPPMLGKVSRVPTISAQWRRAVHAFRHARLIVIIGYSFPETDTFMTRLMAEGIRDNDNLESFIISNLNDDRRWKRHIREIFARSWYSNTVLWDHRAFGDFAKALLLPPERSPDLAHTPAVRLLRSIAKIP